jgi:hypothetical protein
MSEATLASARFVRFARQRPPSAALVFDLTVQNESRGPRWLLVPMQLPSDEGGVFAVESMKTPGEHPTLFARVLGRGGRLAFRLGGGASVTLHNVALTWWGDEPSEIDLPLEFAASVTLEGTDLEHWFAEKATVLSGKGLSVDIGVAQLAGSKTTEGREALPLTAVRSTAITVRVSRDAHD